MTNGKQLTRQRVVVLPEKGGVFSILNRTNPIMTTEVFKDKEPLTEHGKLCLWKEAKHSDKNDPKKGLAFPQCVQCEGIFKDTDKKPDCFLGEDDL